MVFVNFKFLKLRFNFESCKYAKKEKKKIVNFLPPSELSVEVTQAIWGRPRGEQLWICQTLGLQLR